MMKKFPLLRTHLTALAILPLLGLTSTAYSQNQTSLEKIKPIVSNNAIISSTAEKNPEAKEKSLPDSGVLKNSNKPDWLLDNPASPVRVTLAERKNHLFFQNVGGKEVSEIRVGVVRFEKNKYKILSPMTLVEINGKLKNEEIQFAGIAHYYKDIEFALKQKAQLAVVAIKFSDGSTWQFEKVKDVQPDTLMNFDLSLGGGKDFPPLTRSGATSGDSLNQEKINWWANIPASPVTFTITPNGRFGEITNHSNKNIIDLDLGCLKPEGATFVASKFVKKLDSQISAKEQDGGVTNFLAGIHFFSDLANTCVKENSRLGVSKVFFDDGTVWGNFKGRGDSQEKLLLQFELTSIRFMMEEESFKKAPHSLAQDLLVTYRVTNFGNQPIYFYSHFTNKIIPAGNTIKKTAKGVVWLIDSAGRESFESPSITFDQSNWKKLEPGAFIEWEELEISAPQIEERARTLFVKFENNVNIKEVLSDFYTLPARVNSN